MFSFQVGPKYQMRIDRYSLTILRKRNKKDKPEDFIEDDDNTSGDYAVVGYYPSKNLEYLAQVLIYTEICSHDSKEVLSLNEAIELCNKKSIEIADKLKVAKIDMLIDDFKKQEEVISDLKMQIASLKRANKRLTTPKVSKKELQWQQ